MIDVMVDVPIDPAVESLRLLLTIDNLSKGRHTILHRGQRVYRPVTIQEQAGCHWPQNVPSVARVAAGARLDF
jgi:hypothetical protein